MTSVFIDTLEDRHERFLLKDQKDGRAPTESVAIGRIPDLFQLLYKLTQRDQLRLMVNSNWELIITLVLVTDFSDSLVTFWGYVMYSQLPCRIIAIPGKKAIIDIFPAATPIQVELPNLMHR